MVRSYPNPDSASIAFSFVERKHSVNPVFVA